MSGFFLWCGFAASVLWLLWSMLLSFLLQGEKVDNTDLLLLMMNNGLSSVSLGAFGYFAFLP